MYPCLGTGLDIITIVTLRFLNLEETFYAVTLAIILFNISLYPSLGGIQNLCREVRY
jgi:hypothetical protein